MKRIAYYSLHYGKEYLAWSVRSIQDAVDEIHVLYSPEPSFGHRPSNWTGCPESEEELLRQARRFLKPEKPLYWHKGSWGNEINHRLAIEPIAKERGAGLILWIDADEVWPEGVAKSMLDRIEDQTVGACKRLTRCRFVHFFRSFKWVCTDPLMPTRVIDMRAKSGECFVAQSVQFEPVLHFGYAQSEAITRYKWKIHGHQNELREGWLDRFSRWKPGDRDMHPTNVNWFWHPRPTDESLWPLLKGAVHDHPYWDKDLIA